MVIPSYPDIHALGSPATRELFSGPVIVEEKVDGSQLSMTQQGGQFMARSRGKELVDGAVEKLFQSAYDHCKTLPLREGWVYRGECISKPRHNSLTYGRTPKGFFVIFDITDVNGEWLTPAQKRQEAARLDLEVVPCYHEGEITPELVKSFIGRESFLGVAPIEGVVVKPLHYDLYGRDKKVVMGKYVSEAFKEVHRQNWSKDNPQKGDVLEQLISALKSEARWKKAVYRLRDRGELALDPKDIGPLMKEVTGDVFKEETEWVKEQLFRWAKPHIARSVAAGLPEWYKDQLLSGSFNEVADA
jgi:hypothetical protein